MGLFGVVTLTRCSRADIPAIAREKPLRDGNAGWISSDRIRLTARPSISISI